MIQRLVDLLWRHTGRVMALLLICAMMSVFGASRLKLDGDLARLLPQHAPSANGLARLETDYGSQIGQLTLILSGGDADQRRAFADALAPALASIPEIARVERVDPRSELTSTPSPSASSAASAGSASAPTPSSLASPMSRPPST